MVQFGSKPSIEAQRTHRYVSIETEVLGRNVPSRVYPTSGNKKETLAAH